MEYYKTVIKNYCQWWQKLPWEGTGNTLFLGLEADGIDLFILLFRFVKPYTYVFFSMCHVILLYAIS